MLASVWNCFNFVNSSGNRLFGVSFIEHCVLTFFVHWKIDRYWHRDAYGFAVRPQHVQRYREYANIYKVLFHLQLFYWKFPNWELKDFFCLYFFKFSQKMHTVSGSFKCACKLIRRKRRRDRKDGTHSWIVKQSLLSHLLTSYQIKRHCM